MNTRTQIRESGFSLIEVLVSLAILAAAIIPLMAVLGRATEDVYETVNQRKLRYLSQWIVGDLEVGKLNPNDPDEELPYEEGTQRWFADMNLTEDEEEFEGFKFVVEALRDEVITGALDEETALDAGFIPDGNGGFTRAVTNDEPSSQAEGGEGAGLFGGIGGEGEPPPGQLKRVAVIAVIREGETAEEDRVFRLMMYLPHPDEESQSLAGGEGGEGGAGGAGAAGEPGAAGAASNATRRTTGSSSDR